VLTTWLGVTTHGLDRSALQLFTVLSTELSTPLFIVMALVASLGPGFSEEVLLRGVVQRHFVARWDPVSGVLLSSLMFGILHMDLLQGGFALSIGLVLGTVAHRTGTLWPGMIAHALTNLLGFVFARFQEPGAAQTAGPSDLAFGLGGLTVSLIALAWLLRRTR
jgi:membrane protease YdiL (CAAX protease family)